MSLFEVPVEKPAHPRLRIWLSLAGAVLLAILLWFVFRYYPERKAAERFFDAVVAGDMPRAYQIWKPGESYTMQDFLADWSPTGYYGPVKSYQINGTHALRGASGVIVTVQISPYAPFPTAEDGEKNRRTRVVNLWVEIKDKSFSFPPP
ncbi:MAG: hypothetical protein LAN84_03195 [Acidobacteriia bacterium]|nr:hypothetical protein [Terriglobia bacterium]